MYLRPALQENQKDVGVEEGRVNGWKGPLEGPLGDARRSPAIFADAHFLETEPAALVWGAWVFLSSPLYLTTFLRTDLWLCTESNRQLGTPCSLELSFTETETL